MDRTVLADGISAATKKNANFEDLGTTSWQLKTECIRSAGRELAVLNHK
jgi:hypothetical protein